jgi:hypothetical protein
MLTRMRNKMRTTWGQTRSSTMARLPKFLNPDDLTRLSWANRIGSYAEVPDVFKEFFDSTLVEGQAFPYTVLTPSYERFIHKTTEKLICDFGHEINVLEMKGNTFETQRYSLSGVSYIELRTALLAASFKLCGMTSQGFHTSSTLLFNSVTDYLFTPILKKVRFNPVDPKKVDHGAELAKFDCLVDANFKFMNLAKRSLLEGEKVIWFVIQPEIQESVLTFLGKTFFRTISPTHMCILTDRELIVIREDILCRKEARYGGIWDYIALDKLISLTLSEKTGDLLGLTIQLPEDTSFELLFQISAKEELNQLVYRFKECTAP